MQKLESWVDTQQIPARIRYFLGLVPQPPTCWGIKLRKALRLLAILSGAGSRKYTPICLLCGGNRLPPHRGGQRTPKLFLRRIRRKDNFGVRRNKGGGATGVLFSVRDVDVLRLLCWCQNIRPQDLNSISTKAERENLMALGFIKLHERSGTLTLTGSGRALLELIFNGAIPSLSLSYHGAAIERRIRLPSAGDRDLSASHGRYAASAASWNKFCEASGRHSVLRKAHGRSPVLRGYRRHAGTERL